MAETYWHLPLDVAIKKNQSKECKLKNCTRNRIRLSGYCNYHTQRKNLTGDAAGHIPSRAKFRETEKEVMELMELNPGHPGIEYGIDFFSKWIKAAMDFKKGTVAMEAIRYIAARDADPKEMFILSAAIYTVYQREASPFCSRFRHTGGNRGTNVPTGNDSAAETGGVGGSGRAVSGDKERFCGRP